MYQDTSTQVYRLLPHDGDETTPTSSLRKVFRLFPKSVLSSIVETDVPVDVSCGPTAPGPRRTGIEEGEEGRPGRVSGGETGSYEDRLYRVIKVRGQT